MVMRSIKRMLRPAKQAAPHKRMPEEYYKHIYLPKKLYENIAMIAELEKKNVRQTVIEMLGYDITAYVEPRMEQEYQTRMLMQRGLIPYKPPGPFLKLMRKYMDEHGIKNPRIDSCYRFF